MDSPYLQNKGRLRYVLKDALVVICAFWWVPYLLIAVYTFGHNASNHPTYDVPYRVSFGQDEEPPPPLVVDSVPTAAKSALGAALWPAYWSWDLMDNGEAQCIPTN
jgi:hypothetical protein